MNEKVENLKTKGKEYLDKAEEFVEDHYGLLTLGTLVSFAAGMFVVTNKQSKKYYDTANADLRTALMCSLVKNSNNQ